MKIFIIVLIVTGIFADGNVIPKSSESYEDVNENLSDNAAFKNDRDWQGYKFLHKKHYTTDREEATRYENFKLADAKIKRHNEKYERREVLFKMGHNKFSDMTKAEIKRIHPEIKRSPTFTNSTYVSLPTAPESLSYQSSCLPVVDQGLCASSWAFAAVAQVETQLKHNYPTFGTPISQQNVVDCAPNGGCSEAGSIFKALKYMYRKGLVAAYNDPYAGQKLLCNNSPILMREKIAYPPVAVEINGDNEKLMDTLVTDGPLAITMHASNDFFSYAGGIFFDENCSNDCSILNHSMLLVGYGNVPDSDMEFWILRNSHGPEWGENGYIKIIKNSPYYGNNCNVACVAYYTQV